MHVAVDGLGNPVRLILTEGQAADISTAAELMNGLDFEVFIADKAYDADWLRELVATEYNAEVVIPPRSNRTNPADYDKHLYKIRNLVERFIGAIKHFRRVATRYEKTARNFMAFLNFASVIHLLK